MKKEEFIEEFNEKLLYELYKEYPFDNAREIKGFIYKHHGIFPSSDLVVKITNYQINKYGQIKRSGKSLFYKFTKKKHKGYLSRMRSNQRRHDNETCKRIDRETEEKLRRRHTGGNYDI